jgi:DivIVA domain-containing protein
MLTPVDIQQKRFKSGLGFDKKDVSAFFEEVSKSYGELYRSNAELKEKGITLTDTVQHYKVKEEDLNKTLLRAEKNSQESLSNAVKNLTHQNNWARYTVAVGVAYGSDVEKVKKVLLECATSHPKVIKKPAPYVIFKDFGASSLDFELRFYVSDVFSGWTTPSDIRYKINDRFNEEGIEIPFQQVVIHHATATTPEEASKKGKKNAD